MVEKEGGAGQPPETGEAKQELFVSTRHANEAAVEQCIERAGGPGSHILNLGHGVVPQTPEDAVEVFIEKAKSMRREG